MSILASASERYLHDAEGKHVGAPADCSDERRMAHNRALGEHERLHRLLEPTYLEMLEWDANRTPANLRLAEQPTMSDESTGGTG